MSSLYDQLEPASLNAETATEAAALSQAISLKRIADALEANQRPIVKIVEAERQPFQPEDY